MILYLEFLQHPLLGARELPQQVTCGWRIIIIASVSSTSTTTIMYSPFLCTPCISSI